MKKFFKSLNQDQTKAVEKLQQFLTNDSNIFLLKGYAGVGKTYITQGLTKYLKSIDRSFTLSAPTGKAAKVIQEKTNFEAFTIHKTIYSSKNLKEYKKDDDKTYKFYFDLNINELPNDNVYILDEASMISNIYSEMEFIRFGSGFVLDDLMKFINIDANKHNKKIIFIGDNAQLPPINMNFSPALDKNYLEERYNLKVEEFELTEVVRQSKESEILQNSISLRESLKNKTFTKLNISTNKDIKPIDVSDIKSIYFSSTPKNTMIIAYTNKSVYNYNQTIRSQYFKNTNILNETDKLIVTTNSLSTGLSNGDFIMVYKILNDTEQKQIPVGKNKIELKFRDIEIIYKDNNNNILKQEIKIIENLLFSTHPNLSSDENKALYIDFCIRNPHLKPNTKEFTEAIKKDSYFNALKVKFGYAITCHKAQGSEWENVILDCDYTQNKLSESYFRWLYTAITRTKQNLFLINNQKLSQFQQIKIIDSNKTTNPVKNTNDNKFNIQDKFLLTIYQKVKTLLNQEIKEVKHSNFLEKYILENETISIYYNSKNIITNIIASKEIYEILKPLIKVEIFIQPSEFKFEFDFLQQFYEENKQKLKHIKIVNIENFNYMQRYKFQKNEEIAVINFYYSKTKITRAQIHNTTNSNTLAKEILETIFKETK